MRFNAINPRKLILAKLMHHLRLSELSIWAQTRVRKHIRAVYYHEIFPSMAEQFEIQVRHYAQRYHPVNLDDLRGLLNGHWPHPRPGIIISFDDGLRGQAEIAAPILARYGFKGWFFIPGGFVDTPVAEQLAYSEAHQIDTYAHEWPDLRVAMAWDQVRTLDREHIVGCHTWDHTRQRASLTAAEVDTQIPLAKRRLEAKLGHEVVSFCWVGGEEITYSAASAQAVRDAGFEFSFMTNTAVIHPRSNRLQLQRSHVEADFPMEVARFQISGVMDVLYTAKRRRVLRLTR